MEYGKTAIDLLLSGQDDLIARGEAMIAYLSSLPSDVLPAEDTNLLIAMMTVGVARGAAYPGFRHIEEPAISVQSRTVVRPNIADEA